MKKRLVAIMVGMVVAAGCSSGSSLSAGDQAAKVSIATHGSPTDQGGGANTQNALRLRTDDVAVVRITGFIGFPPRNHQPPKPLQADEPESRAKIAKIVEWINAAQVIGGDVSSEPRRVTRLVIELKDGRSIGFRPAVDCTTEQRADGTATRCTGTDGQVVFEPGIGQPPVRLRAPDLGRWLDGGWEQDLPRELNPQPGRIGKIEPVPRESRREHLLARAGERVEGWRGTTKWGLGTVLRLVSRGGHWHLRSE